MAVSWSKQKNVSEVAAKLRTDLGLGTAALADTDDFATAANLTAAVSDMQTYVDDALASDTTTIDPWACVPVGAFVAYDAGESLSAPPTDQDYRYIELTAGLSGTGGYNNGVLTGETVAGSAPSITATAVVSLAGSPLNGKIIRLINTERRFIRPGSPGTLEDSQNLAHSHSGTTNTTGAHTHTGNLGVAVSNNAFNNAPYPGYVISPGSTPSAGDHAHTLAIDADGGTEARPRNIGVKYYRRVK